MKPMTRSAPRRFGMLPATILTKSLRPARTLSRRNTINVSSNRWGDTLHLTPWLSASCWSHRRCRGSVILPACGKRGWWTWDTSSTPEAPNPTQGWVLMNGIPALVNVDDLAMLPQSDMEKDPQFTALRRNHPQLQLAVTSDQRSPDSSPQIEPLAGGGERFVILYALQERCDGCTPLAYASFGFDFDAAGEFLRAKFIRVTTGQP